MKVNWRLPGAGTILASVAIALAVSACSAGKPSAPAAGASGGAGHLGLKAEPPLGPMPVIKDSGSMHLPLDPYFLSPSQVMTMDAAERKAEQACIHRYLPGAALGTYGLPVLQSISSQPLGYLDPAQAARYGYHDPTTENEISELRHAEMGPEVLAVDNGNTAVVNGLRVSAGGCRAVGVAAVINGVPASLVFSGNARRDKIPGIARIINEVITQSDTRVMSVNGKWSSCMARFGYNYRTPGAAVNDQRWYLANVPTAKNQRQAITAAEVSTAVADVTCRSRADLYRVYWAVAGAYQDEWLSNAQNHALAEAQERADQLMLARADAILGG